MGEVMGRIAGSVAIGLLLVQPMAALASAVSDLEGARAAGALSDLESRGFRTVDTFQSGSNGAGTVWWNGRTRQCVQVITVDGHIDSVSDIGTHPRCR